MECITTLISHFYNEEYLLPWWLMHHTKLFDHGILINRGSTDRSIEICRTFAPHWEIRNSRVHQFDAIEADREVMDIEKQCTGWKMVLNTTEFLCVRNKEQFFKSLYEKGMRMYLIKWFLLGDPPNYPYRDPVYTVPLVQQRFHGFFSRDPNQPYMGRLIHNHEHGGYTIGRHWSPHPFIPYEGPAYVCKFVYSPWNDAMRRRKLQIAPTLSMHSLLNYYGAHHIMTPEMLEHARQQFAHGVVDLRLLPEFQSLWTDSN
ncbi:glycosyltransferase family 2 protein [Paenibacillus arenosi]